jgi:CRP/FNR family transcriptional regulator, cyclic AMP receptor protein
MRTLLQIVSHQPFFAELTESQISVLAENARYRRAKPGQLVFYDNNPANRLYVVVAGRVALEASARDGQFIRMQTMGPGDVLGWPSLLPKCSGALRARALEPTELIYFCGSRLRQLCDGDYDLGYHLSQRLADVTMRRLQAARGRLVQQPPRPEAVDWVPGDHTGEWRHSRPAVVSAR